MCVNSQLKILQINGLAPFRTKMQRNTDEKYASYDAFFVKTSQINSSLHVPVFGKQVV